MIALGLRRPGSLFDIKAFEFAEPLVLADEVLVRLEAASLNPVDFKLSLAGHPFWKYPHIPGLDGAGVVERVGSDVIAWKAGDRVAFHADLRKDGVFAQKISVKSQVLARIPDSVSMSDAASLPCAGLTAWRALNDRAKVCASDTMLVQGAAGGVGGFAIQIGKMAGARVIATCSSTNGDYVRGLGADEVIFYPEESVKDRVLELTDGHGVDIAFDPVGGHSATQVLSYLSYGAHLVCLAGLPDLSKLTPSTVAPSIHEISIGACYASGRNKDLNVLGQDLQTLLHLFDDRKLKSFVSKTVSVEDIPSALEELRERHVRGKIVADLRSWPDTL